MALHVAPTSTWVKIEDARRSGSVSRKQVVCS
uniref:HTH psq-type domain-containing protein n=1 Tax=Ascaris lumbricoides TaxID=6252 RepID=A0A0M3I7J3_ASCLU